MNVNQWAIKWGVPPEALAELPEVMGAVEPPVADRSSLSGDEATAQAEVRLEASECGVRLWRNNVGAAHTADGGFIRFGLANESDRVNKVFKSSDLIGIRAVRIQPHHVGQIIGQFVAREVKRPDWRYRGTPRERGQINFLNFIWSMGGDASFATGRGSLYQH